MPIALPLAAVLAMLVSFGPSATPARADPLPKVAVEFRVGGRPVSGSTITFGLTYPEGFTVPDVDTCHWEIWWGDTASLRDHIYNETYGSTHIRGRAEFGFCEGWSVALPYSASATWMYSFGIQSNSRLDYEVNGFDLNGVQGKLVGSNRTSVGSGVTTSSLPGVWLSMPSTTVGEKVTATAHPYGGYVLPPGGATWVVGLAPDGGNWFAELRHSLTYTFTAKSPGSLVVSFSDHGDSVGKATSALVDPRVRPRPTPTSALRAPTAAPTPPPTAEQAPTPTAESSATPTATPLESPTLLAVARAIDVSPAPPLALAPPTADPIEKNAPDGVPWSAVALLAFGAALAGLLAAVRGRRIAPRWRSRPGRDLDGRVDL